MAADKATIQAAGVVLHGIHGDVAVVHRPHRQDWSLPKGKLEPGESHLLAAVRECLEETGYRAVLGPPLPTRRYVVAGVDKEVQNWQARAVSGEFAPNNEVDELRWLTPVAAAELLTYPTDAELVADSSSLPPTVPLLVLRHADAVKRAAWQSSGPHRSGNDIQRPLSPEGLEQSDGIAQVLAAYGVTRIVTSDTRRCRQSVEPYAAIAGIQMTREHLLSEEGFDADPQGTERLLKELLDLPGEPTVICTHRPVLPVVMRTWTQSLGLAADDPLTEALDPRLAPGSLLVLHRDAAGALIAAERHHL